MPILRFCPIYIVCVLYHLLPLNGQAQFQDAFSDGELLTNPMWSGDMAKFNAANKRLDLTAPALADVASLATPSTSIRNAVWEFSVQLDFNPSSANYARIYLVSDQPTFINPLNGYFVMIGDTGDEICLYRQTGDTKSKIIDGLDGRVNLTTVHVKIKVTRDGYGNWGLWSDVGLTGTFLAEGTVRDETHIASSWFGIHCVYTSTRSDKFHFDDFTVSGSTYPIITVSPHEVIINEIFADPDPVVALPEAEYIEIFNRGNQSIPLVNWKLTDGISSGTLGADTLRPGEYRILTATAHIPLFGPLTKTLGLGTFPTLNNNGDAIVLKTNTGAIMDSVRYDLTWYRDEVKKTGGWSLERIDPENPCGEGDNWAASEHAQGGSPGFINSIYANKPDLTGPILLEAIPLSPTTLSLSFNEKLDVECPVPSYFSFDPPLEIVSVQFSSPSRRELEIQVSPELEKGTEYALAIANIRDCNGNVSQDTSPLRLGFPEKGDSLDIVINEVLFNPWPTGVDFVEIQNVSGKFINLNGWGLGHFADPGTNDVVPFMSRNHLVKPGEYRFISTSPALVKAHYPNALEEMGIPSELPSLPDNEGSVSLVSPEGKTIDAFRYDEEMHTPFLRDVEGVSLERISPQHASLDKSNWKSSPTSQGYATPGYLNANTLPGDGTGPGTITIEPPVFEPKTGQPDFTTIRYVFERGGYVANVRVYDFRGREIKTLAENEILGTEGFYRWDGDNAQGQGVGMGYYFVNFQVFDESGFIKTFRQRVIVATRF